MALLKNSELPDRFERNGHGWTFEDWHTNASLGLYVTDGDVRAWRAGENPYLYQR